MVRHPRAHVSDIHIFSLTLTRSAPPLKGSHSPGQDNLKRKLPSNHDSYDLCSHRNHAELGQLLKDVDASMLLKQLGAAVRALNECGKYSLAHWYVWLQEIDERLYSVEEEP